MPDEGQPPRRAHANKGGIFIFLKKFPGLGTLSSGSLQAPSLSRARSPPLTRLRRSSKVALVSDRCATLMRGHRELYDGSVAKLYAGLFLSLFLSL